MRLTDYTDYALRVLMYCTANPTRLVTAGEVAQFHRISKSHLTVGCFSQFGDGCALMPNCPMRSTLRHALGAYFAVLDRVSLAGMVAPAAGAGAGARVEVSSQG